MTVMATAEASRHGRRPTVLYQFTLAAPPPLPESPEGLVLTEEFDYADLVEMAAAGWVIVSNLCPNDPESPVRGYSRFQLEGGLIGLIDTCRMPEPPVVSTATLTLSGFTPGDRAWAILTWHAMGHWFEPLAFTISSADSSRSVGLNPGQDNPTDTTGKITVQSGGLITLRFRLNNGYPTIGHDDVYVVEKLQVFVEAFDEPNPVPEPADVEFFRTSFRRSITYQGNLYTPCEIDHTEPSEGVDDAPGTIQIAMPADDPITQMLLQKIPPARPMVAIYSYHRPPTDEPDPTNVWSSLYDITGIEETIHGATLTCSTLLGQGEALVPAGLVNRDTCDFQTYHPLTCGVNPAAHTFSGVVSAIVGLNVTVTGAAAFRSDIDDYWKLGSIRKDLTATMIRDQAGDTVALEEAIDGLQVGDTVTLLAGDDRTKETCALKFFNSARRRSFPNIPMQNPWYGQGLRA